MLVTYTGRKAMPGPNTVANSASSCASLAGVKSAGNVGRGHVFQNLGVLAKLVGSEAFSEIAVQVDGLDDARIPSSVSVERNSTAQPINLDFAGTKFPPCCFNGDGLESNF